MNSYYHHKCYFKALTDFKCKAVVSSYKISLSVKAINIKYICIIMNSKGELIPLI